MATTTSAPCIAGPMPTVFTSCQGIWSTTTSGIGPLPYSERLPGSLSHTDVYTSVGLFRQFGQNAITSAALLHGPDVCLPSVGSMYCRVSFSAESCPSGYQLAQNRAFLQGDLTTTRLCCPSGWQVSFSTTIFNGTEFCFARTQSVRGKYYGMAFSPVSAFNSLDDNSLSSYDLRYYVPPITAVYSSIPPTAAAPMRVSDVTGGQPSVTLTDAGKAGVGTISAIGILSIFLLAFLLIWRHRFKKAPETPPIEPPSDPWTKHELPSTPLDKYRNAKEIASSEVHEMEAEGVCTKSIVEADAERAPTEVEADRPPVEAEGC